MKVAPPYDQEEVRVVICICGEEVKVPDPFYGRAYPRGRCSCGVEWGISSRYSIYMTTRLTSKEVAKRVRHLG